MSADTLPYRCVMKLTPWVLAEPKTCTIPLSVPEPSPRERAKAGRIIRNIKRLRRGNARHFRRLKHWDNTLWHRYGIAYFRTTGWTTKLASPARGLTIRNFSL